MEVNPLGELSKWYTIIQIMTGLFVVVYVCYRPKAFWPFIIVGSIVGQSLRFCSYQFYDEYILWCALAGASVRVVSTNCVIAKNTKENSQRAVYYLWVSFMVLESIVGIFANDDIRIIRWFFFYAGFGFLAFISYNYSHIFEFPTLKKMSHTIVITALIYDICYLLYGMIWDALLPGEVVGRFDSQFVVSGLVWAGTAVAAYPSLLGVPAALIVINEEKVWTKKIASWLVILITMGLGKFYDSRMTWIVVFGCIVANLHKIKLRYVACLFVAFAVVFGTLYSDEGESRESILQKIPNFFEMLYDGASTLWEKGDKGDVNRRLQFQAAILRITDNPVTFFVGDGMYSHRTTLIPHIEKLYALYLPDTERKRPSGWDNARPGEFRDDNAGSMISAFRTTGFSALLVDTGMIGMMLFAMNYVFVAVLLCKQKSRYKLMLLCVLVLSYWWLFANNVNDVTILYLLIMPGGILESWSREMSEEFVSKPSLTNEKLVASEAS